MRVTVRAMRVMRARVRAMRVMQKGKIKKKKKIYIYKKKSMNKIYRTVLLMRESIRHFLIVFKPSFSRTDVYIRPHFFTAFFLGTSQITKEVDFFVPAGINYQER